MKPKYQINREITKLSKWKLPPIHPDQIQWGYDHCLDKLYHKSRGKNFCLECGHSWKPKNNHKIQVCPECNTRLKMAKDYRSYRNDAAYMAVVTVCDCYQVVRMVWLSKRLKMNCASEYFGKEVMQHFIDENGKHVATMSLSVNGLSAACDSWIFSSEMKVKETRGGYNSTARHSISPWKTFPKVQMLPIFKRNGFKGDFHGVSPVGFFHDLLNDRYFETLLKSKQYSLLIYNRNTGISNRLWSSIKICIRNNYIVKDARIWRDYIDLLEYFRKDTHNAHYVCPKYLHEVHDKLMNKKREIEKRRALIKKQEELIRDQKDFEKQKARFFDLLFHQDNITVRPLQSVEEFMKEGDILHHCVYTNGYYKKPESLIMSARIDDKPIETIEVSLKTMDVVQSRGLQNKPSDYHDQIISLVKRNIDVIAQRKSSKRTQKIAV